MLFLFLFCFVFCCLFLLFVCLLLFVFLFFLSFFKLKFFWLCTGKKKKDFFILFNDALNTFYLRLYGVGHMVKDH